VIDDFRDYGRAVADVVAAAELPPVPLWVMAQSTGCAALVEYARHFSWPFAAAVMLAPLVRPVGWRWGRLAQALLHRFVGSVERKFTANSSDRDFLALLRRDPLQCRRLPLRWVTALRNWLATLPRADLGVGPALLVQGDADKTVDWRYNLEFFRDLFPGSQVCLLPGAGHQLANESVAVRESYLDMVDHYLRDRGMLPAPRQATVPPCDADTSQAG
jgi:alpha-beta hydrolase superfamily lysophospholipase